MSPLVFSKDAIEDLIRKHVNVAGVLVRAAGNQRGNARADVAVSNARQAWAHAMELVRTLEGEHREAWEIELLALQEAIQSFG